MNRPASSAATAPTPTSRCTSTAGSTAARPRCAATSACRGAIGGWLLTPFLMKVGQEGADRLRQRVADEITTTFASTYGMRLSLADAVDPDQVRRYAKMATGDKALVTPHA